MIDFTFNGKKYRALFPELLRPLSIEERSDLEGSIRDHGVTVPVLADESNGIFDGLHRCIISESLGLKEIPVRTVEGLSEEEKRALALEVNDCRRQQTAHELIARRRTRQEKREAIAEVLVENPELSDRAIAEKVEERTGTRPSPTTVGDVRGELSNSGEIGQLPRTTGRDGKSRPARRDAPAAIPPKPASSSPRPAPQPRKPAFAWDVLSEKIRPAQSQMERLVGSLKLLASGSGDGSMVPGRLVGVANGLRDILSQIEEAASWSEQQSQK